MVDVAIACYGGADAASNIIDHLHIKLTVIHPYAHPVTWGDGVWELRYRFHPLGFLNDRTGRIKPLTQWREIARPETPRCKQRV